MGIRLFIIMVYIFLLSNSYAQKKSYFSFSNYLVKNDLNWSISGNIFGGSPNIFSELIFTDILSYGHAISYNYKPLSNLSLQFTIKNQYTFSGKGSDTDYATDNRGDAFRTIKFNSKNGNGSSVDLMGFYSFFNKNNIKIDLGLNYNINKQSFFLTSDETKNLKSNYNIYPKKNGAFLTIGSYFLKNNSSHFTLKLNRLNYFAEADWNLIQDFKHPISFTHSSNGSNTSVNFKNIFYLNCSFSLIFEYEKSIEKYKDGIDKLYLNSGTIKYTKFNGGKLTSDFLYLGFIFCP